jgi:FAD synthase
MNMWDKKIHVKSSLERKDSQWSLFIGRWQPLHEGHKQLFRQVINEGGKVLVAIREGEINEKNPFTPSILNKKKLFFTCSKRIPQETSNTINKKKSQILIPTSLRAVRSMPNIFTLLIQT